MLLPREETRPNGGVERAQASDIYLWEAEKNTMLKSLALENS